MAFNRSIEEPGSGPLTEGDGRGVGNTLGPDVSVETERQEIERGVRERNPAGPPEADDA